MLNIIPNFDLQPSNTLAVPVRGRYAAEVHSVEQLQDLLQWHRKECVNTNSLPLLVLGGGSNVVLQGDFPGLVLLMKMSGIEQVAEDDSHVWIKAGAGEVWHRLVEYCMQFHCWGIENLALIPGSVGAAPIQNIGAYGVELKDIFAELTAVDIRSGVEVVFQKNACEFGYRDSVFKHRLRNRYIITSVTLKLSKEPTCNLSYPALAACFSADQSPTPLSIFSSVCDIRRSKLPDPAQIPNVGSFFKNPVVAAATYQQLLALNPSMPAFQTDQAQVKLAAGWLIEQAGWKGVELGGVVVHMAQALVLTNPQRLSGAAVLALAAKIVADVQTKFGVMLEMEPCVYGEVTH